ncbi:MAG: aldolase/citrate lyase family protein [Alphaproteobacteria bacterium]|nr:aldolase/citrate lyase family protein [Alphaproteobacteria bacterium]
MSKTANPTLQRLNEGKLALGFCPFHLRTTAAPMLALATGYDWLFIDTEHGAFTTQETSQICLAAIPFGITPIVRVCADALDEATRALDNGALGIIVPHVSTVAAAKRVVEALRFPPMGLRSWGAPPAMYNYGGPGLAEAQESLNRDILIGTMIETEEAIANVDEIAKVPGIDMIMIGSTDLTTRMGIPGQWGHEKLQAAYKKVGAACKKNGKHLGLGGIGDNVWAPHYIKQGARMVLAHSDHGMIMEAGTNRANLLRALEKKGPAKKK